MATLQTISLSTIKPNPHRRMETYPLNRRKLDALKQSIDQVGFWEGVIVRPAGNSYENAFGHHRVAAAREQLGEDAEVPVIVRDLDDAQMLQFMGRENAEDYNADFLVMLEAWEAAADFLSRPAGRKVQPIVIARFLGWTRMVSRAKRPDYEEVTDTAEACASAYILLTYPDEDLRLSRSDLDGLTVKDAREVCAPTLRHLETIEQKASKKTKVAKVTGEKAPTAKQVKSVKREYVSSAKTVASDLKSGNISSKKARGQIWSRADVKVREKKLPDFGIAIKQVRKQIQSWHSEEFTDKVKELVAVAEHVQDTEERDEYRFAARDLRDVMDRCERSADRFEKAANPANVAHIKAVKEVG